ncbi:hypothetical protein HPB52_001201 [Rhipicephalus sanguineus]|uniref:Uncharacterized protein n=1 Tax=Rhipicephalus sanguineus TaxID=34632 RepID=A0A9D4PTU2_RHISA|nr:hypothetical protein HPB52_001201 [Rhipicephalus sanguineus]
MPTRCVPERTSGDMKKSARHFFSAPSDEALRSTRNRSLLRADKESVKNEASLKVRSRRFFPSLPSYLSSPQQRKRESVPETTCQCAACGLGEQNSGYKGSLLPELKSSH